MSWWQRLWQYLYDWWTYRGARLGVHLGKPHGESIMANLQFPELDVDGVTIDVRDAGGNPAPLPDPSTVTTSFTSSDPTVLTVAPAAGNPYAATVTSTGKVGTGVTIGATINFNSGAPSISGVSQPIDVPAGPPASVDVVLGTPAPPAP